MPSAPQSLRLNNMQTHNVHIDYALLRHSKLDSCSQTAQLKHNLVHLADVHACM